MKEKFSKLNEDLRKKTAIFASSEYPMDFIRKYYSKIEMYGKNGRTDLGLYNYNFMMPFNLKKFLEDYPIFSLSNDSDPIFLNLLGKLFDVKNLTLFIT